MFFDVLQQTINGLLVGSAYALVGLGFTLIWGVMARFNFAYGATALVGAYAVIGATQLLGMNLPAVVLFAVAVAAAVIVAWLVEVFCFRFLPEDNELAPLMSTLGMMFVIHDAIDRATRGYPLQMPSLFGYGNLDIGPISLRGDLLAVFAVALLIMTGLYLAVYRSPMGLGIRALSQQPIAAQLCGIRLRSVYTLTFLLTGVVAGAAGYLVGSAVGAVQTPLGVTLNVKGLVVSVIGGLGSFQGATVAGMLLGVIEYLALWFLGVTYRDIFAYAALFAILMYRPTGLFGSRASS